MAEGEPAAAADTHKPGENCARDASKVVWECFNGLGKVAKDFYTWWDTKREENAAIGILVAIGVILLCIFILLPAAFALLIVAGVLVISAVIIDAIYGKEESATPKASTEAAPSTEAADEKV